MFKYLQKYLFYVRCHKFIYLLIDMFIAIRYILYILIITYYLLIT
jgi:hypothetical protein